MSDCVDSSRRFILPEGSAYLRNLSAMWAVLPRVAQFIEAVDEAAGPDQTQVIVEPSRSGPPTLAVRAAGRSFSLHSRYDPVAEAAKLTDAARTDSCVAFYLLGLGLGYHLEALFDRASREAVFFVFEADPQVLRAAMMHRDLSRIISSRRVHFITSSDKAEIFHTLTPHSAMCSMGFEGLVHPPSLALHPHFYQDVQTWLTEFAAYARTCLNTLVINGRRTAENITRNLASYARSLNVSELANRYKGRPAIIVSAGPSLRRNKHLLKDADGKAVIIAVQTILQPLLELGIEPQFVTSLDYHDISTRYYEKLPAGLRTHLVAEPKASPAIFAIYPGPVTILGNDFADRMLRELSAELNKGRLPSGSTVAHLAYYLAEHLGCDPVIFVGQDLGFSDGLAYAPGTNIDDVWRPELSRFCTVEMRQWEFIARDRQILRRIPDQQGRPMYTEERLFTYLQQFERDFLRTRTRIIDATEGGARKRGAAVMPLAEALREFCAAPLPEARPDPKPGARWMEATRCATSLQSRLEEARQIEHIARQTLPLLEEMRDHPDDQARVNRAIAKIDLLRRRMDTLGATYDLVTQFTQLSELERFQRDRQMAAHKLEGKELQKKQVERDIGNVLAIAEAAAEFVRTTAEVVQKLLSFTDADRPRQEAA